MKAYKVKFLHSFPFPYPKTRLGLIEVIGLRTCAVKPKGGAVMGGLLLPERYVATPHFQAPKEVPVAFQNGIHSVGHLTKSEEDITLFRCTMSPTASEYGLDHTCSGDFLYSFHEKKLYVWQKQPRSEKKACLYGVSVPLFTEDKHFAGFMIYNEDNKTHDVLTDINLGAL